MVPAALQGELAAATGEVTLKVWKMWLRSLRGGNKNHGAPTTLGMAAARWEEAGEPGGTGTEPAGGK